MSYDTFISYSHTDKHFADALVHHLEQKGIKCWIDHRDLVAGSKWATKIDEAFKNNPGLCMTLIFSAATNNSDDVQNELGLAKSYKIPVIPIKIEDVKPTGEYAYHLSSINWMDAFANEQQIQIEQIAEKTREAIQMTKRSKGITETVKNEANTDIQKTSLNEQKYIERVRKVMSDGQISNEEKIELNAYADGLGLAPERAKELELMVAPELYKSEPKDLPQIEGNEQKLPNKDKETDTSWKTSIIEFLNKIKSNVTPIISFPYDFLSGESDVAENLSVQWNVSKNHAYFITNKSKYKQNITIKWGFLSLNDKRDPLFRTIARDIEEQKVLTDKYYLDPPRVLEISAELRMTISELSNPEVLNSFANEFLSFGEKTWPIINKHYTAPVQ